MAQNIVNTYPAPGGGKEIRRYTVAIPKDLLGMDILLNDSSDFSPYYFGVVRKPAKLKLGGNIFEFLPQPNRFVPGTQILFEAVDSQRKQIPYEIIAKGHGGAIRVCIWIDDKTPVGQASISLVGEVALDDCGCPVPDEWKGIPNVRWSDIIHVDDTDISDTIEYVVAPWAIIDELSIPWQYQTYEDITNINPGSPGSPYTVSGSYISTYNSQPTGSGTGKVNYTLTQTPDTQSVGKGTIQVFFGDLRFSASMVGGNMYVSGGIGHIHGLNPYPVPAGRYNVPPYYATISAVINETTAEVEPAYQVQGIGDIQSYYPTAFHTKNGHRHTWTETSNSISFTDPTAPSSSITRKFLTEELAISYADIELFDLKPHCGVATFLDVYSKSERYSGNETKMAMVAIEPFNFLIDEVTSMGQKVFAKPIGDFANNHENTLYWDINGNNESSPPTAVHGNSALMNSIKVDGAGLGNGKHAVYSHKSTYNPSLYKGTDYFIEFDAVSEKANDVKPVLDVFMSGSGIFPTNTQNATEKAFGQHVGTLTNNGNSYQQWLGNSFEYYQEYSGKANLRFVVRSGTWHIKGVKLMNCPGEIDETGITPNHTRLLIPMPTLAVAGDCYDFTLRYANKDRTAEPEFKTSACIMFDGTDPGPIMESHGGDGDWFIGQHVLTSSRDVWISGSLTVSGTIRADEFYTNIVSKSISQIIVSGSTRFGDNCADVHVFTGSIKQHCGDINGGGDLTIRNITASNNITASTLIANSASIPNIYTYALTSSYISNSYNITTNNFTSSFGNVTHLTASLSGALQGRGSTIHATGSIEGTASYGRDNDWYAQGQTYVGGLGGIDPVIDGQIYHSGSVGIGDYYNNPIPSKLTVDGDISSSGFVSATDMTASGDISASGTVYVKGSSTSGVYVNNEHALGTSTTVTEGAVFGATSWTAIHIGRDGTNNKNIELHGPVTASGNISASGDLHISSSEKKNDSSLKILLKDVSSGLVYHTGSFGGDNLGNHTATQDLDMNGNSISNSLHITASGTGSFGYIRVTGQGVLDGPVGIGLLEPTGGIFNVSGTSRLHGNTYITGNLFVSDIVVAQEFHTEFVSASITFASGSNKMGDTSDDVHQMSGSVRVTGSGPHYFIGGGNVGINTSTPTAHLTIVGDTSGSQTGSFHFGKFGPRGLLQLYDNTTNAYVKSLNSDLHIGTNRDEDNVYINVGDNCPTRMFISSSGDVGIGTTNPEHALTVIGDISASGRIYGLEFHTQHVSSSIIYVSGSTKFGDSVDDKANFTGSIHLQHTQMSIFTGSGKFGFGLQKPGTISFTQKHHRLMQIYSGSDKAVTLNVTNWETASAFIAQGGTPGASSPNANGPRAIISVTAYNSSASYGLGGTKGATSGIFAMHPDTYQGSTTGDDLGDGGDVDSQGNRLLQEVLHITTGGNPQGSINLHARGDRGQEIRFFTGNDDARNTGGVDTETQRMTIKHDGGVGIGTHNPQRRLHVSNSLNHGSTTPIVRFTTLPSASDARHNIVLVDSTGDLYQGHLGHVNTLEITHLTASSVSGSHFHGYSGSFTHTQTYALTASIISASENIITNRFTASNADITYLTTTQLTASTANITNLTASSATGSFTGSFLGTLTGTASWAQNVSTASHALFTVTSSHALGGSGSFRGYFSGSLYGTASWAQSAVTASYGRDNDWYKQGTVYGGADPTIDGEVYHSGTVGIGDYSSNPIPSKLTVDGDISSSGFVSATDITASGDISSSRSVFAQSHHFTMTTTDYIRHHDNFGIHIKSTDKRIVLTGNLTASGDGTGNISASGDLHISSSEKANDGNLRLLVKDVSTGLVYHTASYTTAGADGDWYDSKTVSSNPINTGSIYHSGSVGIGDFSTTVPVRQLHITQSLTDYKAKTPPVRINSLHSDPQKNIVTWNSGSGDLSYTQLGCALDLMDKDNCCCHLHADTNIYIFIDDTSLNITGAADETPNILTRWVITKFEKDLRERYSYWKGNIYVGTGVDGQMRERWLSWMSWPAVGNQNELGTGSGITGSMESVRWTATGVTDEDAGTYASSDDFIAFGMSSSAYYLENSPISASGVPDENVIVFAIVDETNSSYHGGGPPSVGFGSEPTDDYKKDYGLFVGNAYTTYDCFSGFVYALPSTQNMTANVRQQFALHLYGAIEPDIVSPQNFVGFSPTQANLNAITSSNPYANAATNIGAGVSPHYQGGIYGLKSQSISEKHDFYGGVGGWYGNLTYPVASTTINKSGSWIHGQASFSNDMFKYFDGNSIGVKVDGTTICVNDANELFVRTGSFRSTNVTTSFAQHFTASYVSASANSIFNYLTASWANITSLNSAHITSSVISASNNIITNRFTASRANIDYINAIQITASIISSSQIIGTTGNFTHLTASSATGSFTGSFLGNLQGTASYGKDNDWFDAKTATGDPLFTGSIYHSGSVGIGDFSGQGPAKQFHISQSLTDYQAKAAPVRINSLHSNPQKNIVTYNSASGDISYTELGCALDLMDKDNCCCHLHADTNIYIFIDRTSMNIVSTAINTPAILTRWVITKFEQDMKRKYPYWKGNIYVGEGTDGPASGTLTSERWLSWMSWPAVGNQNETSTGSGITGSLKSVRWTATGATDEDAGTYTSSDDFVAFGASSSAYYLENAPISASGVADTNVIVFALVDETEGGNGNQGTGYHYRQTLVGSGSAPGTLENDWENHLTTHYKADYGLFVGKAYPSYDCFSGFVYALPNSTGITNESRQNFALHIYGAIEEDVVAPADFVSFSPTTANLNAITGSNPYAKGVNSVGNSSPWYTGGIYGLASQSISEKHDFPTGIAGWYGNIGSPSETNINKSGSWAHGQASMSSDFFTFIDGNSIGVKVDGTTICVNDANELFVRTGSLVSWKELNVTRSSIPHLTSSHVVVQNGSGIHTNHLTASGNITQSGNGHIHGWNGHFHTLDVHSALTASGKATFSRIITSKWIKATGSISTLGNITASGNISTSKTLYANNIVIGRSTSTGGSGISATNITASNNLTASQILVANDVRATGSISTRGNITASGYVTTSNLLVSNDIRVTRNLHVTNSISVATDVTASGVVRAATASAGYLASTGQFTASGLFNVSGTSRFHGNTYVTGNLFVSDIVVAQEFHTEFVSASIVFASGSNILGDDASDVAHITGSIRVSGSGPHYIVGGPVGIGTIRKTTPILQQASPYMLTISGSVSASKDLSIGRHITASGNISASGYVSASKGFYTPHGFTGSLKGNADTATTATKANTVNITNTSDTDATFYLTYVDATSGYEDVRVDSDVLTYNPSSNTLTTTNLAGTLATADQPNVTSLGILTSLNVNNDIHITGSVISTNVSTSAITASNITASNFIGYSASFTHIETTVLTASGDISASATSTGSFGLIETPRGINFPNSSTNQGSGITYFPADSTGDLDKLIFTAGTRNMLELRNPRIGTQASSGEVVINNDSLVIDFRVESNGNTNMLIVSGSEDKVGIGTPVGHIAKTLTVQGDISASGNIYGTNISASGVITSSGLLVQGTISSSRAISTDSHITASGNISASGYITSSKGIFSAGGFTGSIKGNADTVTTNANLTGDITSTGNATAIATGVIVNDDINASAGIVDTKLDIISTANKVEISAINIEGGTDIGGALVSSDLFIVDDGANGTNRKVTAERIQDYVLGSSMTTDITTTGTITAGTIIATTISSSRVTSSIVYSSGSNIFGDNIADTHTFNGHITASGNISASGNFDLTGNANIDGTITIANDTKILGENSSGNGRHIAYVSTGNRLFLGGTSQGTTVQASAANLILDSAGDINIDADSGNVYFKDDGTTTITLNTALGHISASGDVSASVLRAQYISSSNTITANNISASGNITGSNIFASGYISALSHITASGNISSSAYIYADRYYVNENHAISYHGASSTYRLFNVDDSNIGIGSISENSKINLWGNVTASGNLSSSGDITANNLTTVGNISGSFISASKGISTAGNISGSYISSSKGFWTAGEYSGSSLVVTNNIQASGSIAAAGNISGSYISGSKGIYTDGSVSALLDITASRDLKVVGNIILDDGGEIREAGGTSAFTFDGDGNVTKIGQDTPSTNEVLTWDGSKWVAAAGGSGGSSAADDITAGDAAVDITTTVGNITIRPQAAGSLIDLRGTLTSGDTQSILLLNTAGDGGAHFTGHVTASGNVSQSGCDHTASFGRLEVCGRALINGNLELGGEIVREGTTTGTGVGIGTNGQVTVGGILITDQTVRSATGTTVITLDNSGNATIAGSLTVRGEIINKASDSDDDKGIKEEVRDLIKDIVQKNEQDGSKIITRIQDAAESKFEVQKNDGSKSVLFSVDKDGKLEGLFDYDGGTY